MSDSLQTRRPKRDQQRQTLADLAPSKEPTTRYTIDLDDSLHRRLKIQAATEGRTMKDVVVAAVEVYLDGEA